MEDNHISVEKIKACYNQYNEELKKLKGVVINAETGLNFKMEILQKKPLKYEGLHGAFFKVNNLEEIMNVLKELEVDGNDIEVYLRNQCFQHIKNNDPFYLNVQMKWNSQCS